MYRFDYEVSDHLNATDANNGTVSIIFSTVDEGNVGLHVDDIPDDVRVRRQNLNNRIESAPVHYMNQTHSTLTGKIDIDDRDELYISAERDYTADALISTSNQPLAVMTADCVPLILVASSKDGIESYGAVHAGRKGLLDDIVESAVNELVESAAADNKVLTRLDVVIGPHICSTCYEVSQEMRKSSVEILPALEGSFGQGDAPRLDLLSGVLARIETHGAKHRLKVHIELFTSNYQLEGFDLPFNDDSAELRDLACVCTYEDPNFYSYRRFTHSGNDKDENSRENINGRFASIVSKK